MKHSIKTLCTLLLTTLLTACGFHLQKDLPLAPPLHHLYLQTADPYGHLARDLRRLLKMSHVELASSASDATTTLAILQDNTSESLLSVSGTQQTRQYLLRVTVVFEIENKQGATIVPAQTLTETRAITIQSNQILGTSNEANLYYQQMRRQLAYAIMMRLSSNDITQQVNQAEKPAAKPKKSP